MTAKILGRITQQANSSNLTKITQNDIQKFEQAIITGTSIKKGTQSADFHELMPD